MMRPWLAGILAFSLYPAPAGAILIRADRDDAEYLELATRYTSSVLLEAPDGEGVLIAPRWVLTAAHRAKALQEMKAPPRLRFGARDHEIQSMVLHPDWTKGGHSDVALILLEEPVRNVEPTLLYRGADEGGKSLVIVGHGAIGTQVGAVARGLGMTVLGVRRGPVTEQESAAGVEGAEALPRLLARADVVVNLLPLTPETESFWSSARFALLPHGAVFVNASRGRCVDDAALLAGLGKGRPARAILDVFREEPLPEGHPFWKHPAVWITPHVAGLGTEESEGRAFGENWRRWREGKPLLHVVERRRGY